MIKRILLTGARGFVGRHLVAILRERFPSCAIIACVNAPADFAAPNERCLDLRDQRKIAEIISDVVPDMVVHLAAQSSVARAGSEGDLTWSVNLIGSLNLALAISRYAPQASLLFVSTGEVYGASYLGSPVSETTSLLPMNAYARSKALAERMFADVLPHSNRLIVVRPCNHTGAGQGEQFVLPSFAGQIARIEAKLQPPSLVVGNLNVRRDFLDVRDVVDAYIALIERVGELPGRLTLNLSAGSPQLLSDLVEELRALSTARFEIAVDPARVRPIDLPLAYADSSLLRSLTGWAPKRELRSTMVELLETARVRLERSNQPGVLGETRPQRN